MTEWIRLSEENSLYR